MNSKFDTCMVGVKGAFRRLLTAPCWHYPLGNIPLPQKGVYLLSEGTEHLYVGRSNRVRGRLNEHQRESADTNAASFAALLARRACGMQRDYGPREARESPPDWDEQFRQAKARIRGMEIRVVEESDPVRQALLEIYVATELNTPYNDFGNH